MQTDRVGESSPCRGLWYTSCSGLQPWKGCLHLQCGQCPWAQQGQTLHVWVGSSSCELGVQGTEEPECISCIHGLCTRKDVTPPGTGNGGSSLGSCAGHGVELRSGCFAFPASAHAAFLCWSYAEKLRFMYCMKKKTKQKKRKNPNVPK